MENNADECSPSFFCGIKRTSIHTPLKKSIAFCRHMHKGAPLSRGCFGFSLLSGFLLEGRSKGEGGSK